MICIIVSLCFLAYIAFLVVKNKLRVEYSIFWIVSSLVLILFSFWRQGLEIAASLLGVYVGINLAFAAAIFAVLIYLLHLSIVVSKLHEENKALAQRMALIGEELKSTGGERK